MTKHPTPEEALKCALGFEEADRADTCVVNLLEKNAILIKDARSNLMEEDRAKISSRKTKKSLKKSRLAKITEKLYDLEPCCMPEQKMNIDLGLYQMEDY